MATEKQCFAIFGTRAPAFATRLGISEIYPGKNQRFPEGQCRGGCPLLSGLHCAGQLLVQVISVRKISTYIRLQSTTRTQSGNLKEMMAGRGAFRQHEATEPSHEGHWHRHLHRQYH
jgi:hypothetical protein